MLRIQANSGLWDVRPERVTDRAQAGLVGSGREAEESASVERLHTSKGEDRLTY